MNKTNGCKVIYLMVIFSELYLIMIVDEKAIKNNYNNLKRTYLDNILPTCTICNCSYIFTHLSLF